MNQPTFNFVFGLPRSGSTVLSSILQQNPNLHSAIDSSLAPGLMQVHQTWPQRDDHDIQDKKHVMQSMMIGMYQRFNKSTIFSHNLDYVQMLPMMEAVLDQPIKAVVCVRNPAEILAALEATRRNDPLRFNDIDTKIDKDIGISIPSRCHWHASPGYSMGKYHRGIQDLVMGGMIDRLLFVDYNLLCGNPQTQIKRVYEFFDLPSFDHDFNRIPQGTLHVRPKLERKFLNPVAYLGLELFDNYNKQIFWNAWI